MMEDYDRMIDQKASASMLLPSYYLARPAFHLDQATIAAYEDLWAQITTSGTATLPRPCWPFLCYLTDHKSVVLHGSGLPDLPEVAPRQAIDVLDFANQHAIYAASDGIWPIFFAILDRERYPMSMTNACLQVVAPTGVPSEPFYFFSISDTALAQQPWRTGTVYILPSSAFTPQPPIPYENSAIHVLQWASTKPVKPLAQITVTSADFPFLNQIRGHDDLVQQQRIQANPDGFPWVDE